MPFIAAFNWIHTYLNKLYEGKFFAQLDITLVKEMASDKHFNDLPDELLIKIFSYISMEDLAMSVQHVSGRWKDVSQDNALWKKKVFSPDEKTTDEEIARCLKNMPALKAYCPKRGTDRNIVNILCQYCKNIDHIEFTWSQKLRNILVKRILEAFPNIVNLSIPIPQERGNHLEFAQLIGQFENLTTLNFTERSFQNIAEGTLMAIADGCSSLQHLDLGYFEFPELEIRYLLKKRGHQLLYLHLSCYISTLGHELLCKCTNLKYLNYENSNNDLPRTYMDHLSRLSKLEELKLCEFKENQTKNIPNIFYKQSLSKLVNLSIYFCDGFGTAELTGIFTNCLQIQFLLIRGCIDSGDGFKYIGNLKQLEHLDIACSDCLSDKGVEYIGVGCKNLKHLDMGYCLLLTTMSVEYVCAGCPKLKYLSICECPLMTDAVIESVIKCKELTFLDMKWNDEISGSHFHMIPSNLTHLKELDIYGCENVDPKCVAELQEEMPRLKIVEVIKETENEGLEIDLEDSRFFTSHFV
ncbi:F-box/LRR-repeat protein fbxl-1-like isoform X5 [Periplaneta americana]|uniref:F-box/LRR-repeat protein fbxl-1-like isoform X5 n=1 Tax=Periplaneta americana TaxID=6978 RepID=UPI0037E94D6A